LEEKHFGPVWVVPGENGGRYPSCHSLYIEGPGILIDPASDRNRLLEIRENPGVKEIWLSHWHEDHMTHLDLFDDLPLHIGKRDATPISDIELFMDAYGIESDTDRAYWREQMIRYFHFRPRKADGFFKGGEIIDLDTVTVEVIGTPGHTPGHVSFFFREPGLLFMGDYDLSAFGPWYGDVESSIEETIASIARLRSIPARVWVTGHDQGIFEEEPGKMWDHYLGVITRRQEKLLHLLEIPRTLEDIIGSWIIYGKPREPKAFYAYAERAMIMKHLELLVKEGTVAMEGNRYYKA